MAQFDNVSDIARELRRRSKSAFDSHDEYIPIDDFQQVMSENTVRIVLRKADESVTDANVNDVFASYRKILAILILIDMPCKIWDFRTDNLSDNDLPLSYLYPKHQSTYTARSSAPALREP
jgi:hypothetical protein